MNELKFGIFKYTPAWNTCYVFYDPPILYLQEIKYTKEWQRIQEKFIGLKLMEVKMSIQMEDPGLMNMELIMKIK